MAKDFSEDKDGEDGGLLILVSKVDLVVIKALILLAFIVLVFLVEETVGFLEFLRDFKFIEDSEHGIEVCSEFVPFRDDWPACHDMAICEPELDKCFLILAVKNNVVAVFGFLEGGEDEGLRCQLFLKGKELLLFVESVFVVVLPTEVESVILEGELQMAMVVVVFFEKRTGAGDEGLGDGMEVVGHG